MSYRWIRQLATALSIAVFCIGSSAFADEMFLKIDGIKGESTVEGHEGSIEIFAYSQDIMNAVSNTAKATGASRGKVSFSDISFKSYITSASPKIMLACASGTHIPKAVLTVRKSGEVPHDYIKIELKDILVSSYKATNDIWQEVPSEDFSVSFLGIIVTVFPGDGDGEPVIFSWDLLQGKKR